MQTIQILLSFLSLLTPTVVKITKVKRLEKLDFYAGFKKRRYTLVENEKLKGNNREIPDPFPRKKLAHTRILISIEDITVSGEFPIFKTL